MRSSSGWWVGHRVLVEVVSWCAVAGAAVSQSNVIPGLDGAVGSIANTTYWGRRGAAFPNGEVGLGFATSYCNTGSVAIPVQAAMAANHPFVAMLVVRESGGRMQQIADRSFCFHDFLAVATSPTCGPCIAGPTTQLNPGCTNGRTAGNLGDRFWLGPASEVQPWLGDWSPTASYFDQGDPPVSGGALVDSVRSLTASQIAAFDPVKNRIVVRESELQAAGTFYCATQLVVRGEAAANRGDNLAFRRFTPSWTGTTWQVPTSGDPMQLGSVLTAWSGASVGMARNGNDDGTFAVGVATTDLGGGMYHYEYAVHNIDNARGGASLRIPVPPGSMVANLSFRDIDANPLNDWGIAWLGSTVEFTAPAGNPLDWNSIFNFAFDCNVSPGAGSVTIDEARLGPGALAVTAPARVPTGAPLAAGAVTINELLYDDGGFGPLEFVELHNASPSGVDLSGWVLRRRTASGALADLMFPPGTTIAAGAFLVAGGTGVPNRSVTFPTANYLPDGAASLTLFDAGFARRDSVVYGAHLGVFVNAPTEGQPLFGAHRIDSAVRRSSWSRYRDGRDTDDNAGDFRVAEWTPGTTNNLVLALPWQPSLDPLAVSSAVPDWWGPQDDPRVVDPTVTSTYNPHPAPVPPPGALHAMAFSTPNGAVGARSYLLRTDWRDDFSFDGYFWLDPTPAPPGESYAWSVGIRGTTDSGYAMPDPLATDPNEANGDTGVTWTFVATDAGTMLYLIDNAEGGRSHQVLTSIPNPSGWQRLRLDVDGSTCYARFGGTVGLRDGVLFRAGAQLSSGGVYVGYRNGVTTGSLAQPAMVARPVGGPDLDESSTVGSGCQGSCPPKNPNAVAVDTTLSKNTNGNSLGGYAFYVPSTQSHIKSICVLSGTANTLAQHSTVTLLDYVDVQGVREPDPNAVLLGPVTLTAPGSNPGWWFSDVDFSHSGPFYLVFEHTGYLQLPVAAYNDKDPLEYVGYHYRPSSGTWTPRDGDDQRPWAWKFVCQDMAGRPKLDKDGFAGLGGSFSMVLDGGGASSIGLDFLAAGPPLTPGIPLLPLGMPGCFSHLQTLILTTFVILDPHGRGVVPLTIPNSPAYFGLVLTGQWATPDPINSFGLVSSDALTFTVQ